MPHPQPTTNGLRPGKRETRKHPAAGTEQANQHLQDPACFMLLACVLVHVSIPAYLLGSPTVWSIASTVCNRACTVLSKDGSLRAAGTDHRHGGKQLEVLCAHSLQTTYPNYQRPAAIILRVFPRPSHTHHSPSATRPDSLGPLA